jgi:hypothetical protein
MRRLRSAVLALVFLAGCAEKPILELQQVEEAIATARDAEADIYAPEEYEFALLNLEDGLTEIEAQDAEPVWRRDYGLALDLLALAYEQAGEAQVLALENKDRIFDQAQNALPEAERLFQMAFEAVEAALTGPVTRRQIQAFDDELAGTFATLNQARESFESGDYTRAFVLLQEVQGNSVALESRARQIVALGPPPR